MKCLKTLACVFAVCTSAAAAQDCTGKDLIVLPEMEAAKTAFFNGRYDRFARLMGPNFTPFAGQSSDMFGPLEQYVSGAYASCHTVLQRHESPGFYQDVVIYYDDEVDGPITLLLIGADFDGEFRFLEFTFNSSLSVVLESVR